MKCSLLLNNSDFLSKKSRYSTEQRIFIVRKFIRCGESATELTKKYRTSLEDIPSQSQKIDEKWKAKATILERIFSRILSIRIDQGY